MKNTTKLKNTVKLLGIAALVAAIIFSFASCDDLMNLVNGDKPDDNKSGSTDDGKSGNTDDKNTNLGNTLTLSGQVYVPKMNYDPPSVSFEAYKEGDLTVNVDGMTEKGTIKNGQFSITLGTPASDKLVNLEKLFDDDDMTVSPSSAKGYPLSLYIENSDGRRNLDRGNHTVVSTTSETQERVLYFYVDTDVTISSKEKTETDDNYGGATLTSTTKAFSLLLKAGWNILYMKAQASINESSKTIETVTTFSLANPSSLKWVLGGSDGGSSGGDITGDVAASGNSLIGTWIAYYEGIVESILAEGGSGTRDIYGKQTYILTFTTASTFTMSMKTIITETDEERVDSISGTYTVNGNNVVLRGDDMLSDGLSGVISGSTIVFSGAGPDDNITFTRQ